MAEGEALDLMHGSAFTADQKIYAGSYEEAADSDIFLITAGLRRKPDESRLDLINRNVALFAQILESIKQAGMRNDAIIFVVSNPVDILTHLAVQKLGLPWQQVIGLGTMLDSTRFSSLIAEALKVAPTQVKALTLGEHGDSMVPIWSSSSINGLPLTEYPGCGPAFQNQIFTRTRGSGAAFALDQKRILPVSSLVQGVYNVRDVCYSVPTVVGRKGVLDQVELKLWPKEQTGLQQSARALKETMAKVQL